MPNHRKKNQKKQRAALPRRPRVTTDPPTSTDPSEEEYVKAERRFPTFYSAMAQLRKQRENEIHYLKLFFAPRERVEEAVAAFKLEYPNYPDLMGCQYYFEKVKPGAYHGRASGMTVLLLRATRKQILMATTALARFMGGPTGYMSKSQGTIWGMKGKQHTIFLQHPYRLRYSLTGEAT